MSITHPPPSGSSDAAVSNRAALCLRNARWRVRRFSGLMCVVLLLSAGSAFGQHSGVTTSPAGIWELQAGVVSWIHQRGPSRQPCDRAWLSQGGGFCTSAVGEGLGPLGSVSRRVSGRIGLGAEAALGVVSARGLATYYRYTGHFDMNRTDATYAHRELLVSGVIRAQITSPTSRVEVTPLAGLTLGRGMDRVTEQVQVASATFVPTTVTTYPEDEGASILAVGAIGGVDVGVAVTAHTSLVGMMRVRWMPWGDTTWPSAGPQPVGVGRWAVQVGGGVRWSQRW